MVPDDVDAVEPDDVFADDPDEDEPVRRVLVVPLDRRAVEGDEVVVAGGAAISAWFRSTAEMESIGIVGTTDKALSTGDLSAFVQAVAASTTAIARKIRFIVALLFGLIP